MEDFLFGYIEASTVQYYAFKGVFEDGLHNQMMRDLAKLRNSRAHDSDINRDLRTYIKKYVPCMEVATMKLPLRILKGPQTGVHEMDVSWIPPHQWLHFLYTAFPAEFKRRALGPPGAL